MDYLAVLNIGILSLIGLFHLYWALGGLVGMDLVLPVREGKLLFRPSSLLTFLVALLVFFFAYLIYALQFSHFEGVWLIYGGWGISLLFLFRAIGEFNVLGFFKKIKGTPFAKYDSYYFSPLCLFLAISFAMITYQA